MTDGMTDETEGVNEATATALQDHDHDLLGEEAEEEDVATLTAIHMHTAGDTESEREKTGLETGTGEIGTLIAVDDVMVGATSLMDAGIASLWTIEGEEVEEGEESAMGADKKGEVPVRREASESQHQILQELSTSSPSPDA